MPTLNNKSKQRPWLVKSKAFDKTNKLNNEPTLDVEYYNSNAWRKLAKQHKIIQPVCVICKRNGYIKETKVSDHIKPSRLFPELKEDINNLQGLCITHHNKKSNIERKMKTRKDYYKFSYGKNKSFFIE